MKNDMHHAQSKIWIDSIFSITQEQKKFKD